MKTRSLTLASLAAAAITLTYLGCSDSDDDRCATGKVCTKDCGSDADCDYAYTCNSDGRCESSGPSCKTNELSTDCGGEQLYCCATGNAGDCCDEYSRCSSNGFCIDRAICLTDDDCIGGADGGYARCNSNHQCESLRSCDGSCSGADEKCSGTVCVPQGTCLTTGDCPSGELCSTGYRCLPDNSCGDAQFVGATAIKPNILMVLDRSGSMEACQGEPADGACCGNPGDAPGCSLAMTSRWTQAQNVIRNVTLLRQDDVRFGISIFPQRCGDAGICDGTGFCAGHGPCPTRCNVCSCNAMCDGEANRNPGQIDIRVDEDKRQEILSFLNLTYPGGGTPTGPTLRNIRGNPAAAGLADELRNNAIVLITDGEANSDGASVGGCGGNDFACKVDDALDDLRALAQPITTFVVGFAFNEVSANLNCHAVHGGSPRTDRCPGVNTSTCSSAAQACYYEANDAGSLAEALEDIITLLASCTYVLDDPVSDPTRMYVYLEYREGQTLPADCSNPELRLCRVQRDTGHSTGWDLDGTQQQIDFAGASCDLVRTGVANPVMVFGCPPSQ